jgi:Protein of unknown function (DUF3800)
VLGLTVYADESGTHDGHGLQPGSEVTAIAGYIADQPNWQRLTRRWNTARREFGIEGPFHVSSYWRNEEPYGSWSDAKKKKCLSKFIRIARDNTWFAIGGMVPTKHYDQILAPEIRDPRLGELGFEHPYHFCFQMLFVRMMEYLNNEIDERFPRKLGFKEKVAFVFDRQQQFEALATRNFNRIKKIIDPEDRLASITYGSKQDHIPLQAADLLAFYTRRILTHQNQGKPWQDPFERMLEERHNLMLHYFTREQMIEFASKILAAKRASG